MSRTDTWMPLYIADYLVDTMRLTTEQHGAYLLLLMEYWRQGPLPDDDRELATIAKAERKTWEKDIGPAVRRFFQRQEDGLLHQKRIDVERQRAIELSDKRRNAAQQRGSKKPSNNEQLEQQKNSNSSAIAPDLQPSLSRDLPQSTYPSSLRSDGAGASLLSGFVEPKADTRPIRDVIWSDGLAIVRDLTGLPEKKARSQLGLWCKALKDDCGRLLAILADAQSTRPIDAVAWISRAVTPKAREDPWASVMAEINGTSLSPDANSALDLPPDGYSYLDLPPH